MILPLGFMFLWHLQEWFRDEVWPWLKERLAAAWYWIVKEWLSVKSGLIAAYINNRMWIIESRDTVAWILAVIITPFIAVKLSGINWLEHGTKAKQLMSNCAKAAARLTPRRYRKFPSQIKNFLSQAGMKSLLESMPIDLIRRFASTILQYIEKRTGRVKMEKWKGIQVVEYSDQPLFGDYAYMPRPCRHAQIANTPNNRMIGLQRDSHTAQGLVSAYVAHMKAIRNTPQLSRIDVAQQQAYQADLKMLMRDDQLSLPWLAAAFKAFDGLLFDSSLSGFSIDLYIGLASEHSGLRGFTVTRRRLKWYERCDAKVLICRIEEWESDRSLPDVQRMSRYLLQLLHEMVHLFLDLHLCTGRGCQTYFATMSGRGFNGHGIAWQQIARQVFDAMQHKFHSKINPGAELIAAGYNPDVYWKSDFHLASAFTSRYGLDQKTGRKLAKA